MIKNVFILLGMTLLITACASPNYRLDHINGEQFSQSNKLPLVGKTIYLVNGGDGNTKKYFSLGDNHTAEGSGVSAANVANDVLTNYTNKVTLEKRPMLQDKALEIGAVSENDYLIYSVVEEWVDPLGINCHEQRPDYASVQVHLYDIKANKLLNSTRVSAKDCPPTVNGIPVRAGSPEKLYSKLFEQWLASIFIGVDKNKK